MPKRAYVCLGVPISPRNAFRGTNFCTSATQGTTKVQIGTK